MKNYLSLFLSNWTRTYIHFNVRNKLWDTSLLCVHISNAACVLVPQQTATSCCACWWPTECKEDSAQRPLRDSEETWGHRLGFWDQASHTWACAAGIIRAIRIILDWGQLPSSGTLRSNHHQLCTLTWTFFFYLCYQWYVVHFSSLSINFTVKFTYLSKQILADIDCRLYVGL